MRKHLKTHAATYEAFERKNWRQKQPMANQLIAAVMKSALKILMYMTEETLVEMFLDE